MTTKYIAPNNKHYAIDEIVFNKKGRKLTAELRNTNAGLVLQCKSRKFLKRAAKLAGTYHLVK